MDSPSSGPERHGPEQPKTEQYSYSLPVVFFWSNGMAKGRCLVVSEHGMLVAFKQELEIWITGSLTAEINERHISIKARVVRVHQDGTGLAFRVTTERERHELLLLLSAAMAEGKLITHEI